VDEEQPPEHAKYEHDQRSHHPFHASQPPCLFCEPHVDLVELFVHFAAQAVNLVLDMVHALFDAIQALVDLVQALVDVIQSAFDPVEPVLVTGQFLRRQSSLRLARPGGCNNMPGDR
jgi:hypothetical protein